MTRAVGSPHLPLLAAYGDPAMSALFSRAEAVAIWLRVERELALAQADLGVIPREAAEEIIAAAVPQRVDLDRLDERMRVVGYPILPLMEQVVEGAPVAVGHYLHWGATTQDIMDTGDALRYTQALELLSAKLEALGDEIAALTVAHRSTVMAGRTHGQQAVPTTFGAKTATWLVELARHRERLAAVRRQVAVVQLFGAAGTNAALGPVGAQVRARLAERLRLASHPVPAHTTRDDRAELGFVLALVCASVGKMAREIAALARTEISELFEADGVLRGASSTMPQKRNPIDSEAVVGLATVAIQQVPVLLAAMQAVHERATGEWQAEWDVLPLLFGLAGGVVQTGTELMRGLQVAPERMRANLTLDGGRIMAESVMMAMAPAIGRASAHDAMHTASRRAAENGRALGEMLDQVVDPAVMTGSELEHALDPDRYLGEAEAIADAAVAAWFEQQK